MSFQIELGEARGPGGTDDYCQLALGLLAELRVAAQWLAAALDAIILATQVVINSPHIGSRGARSGPRHGG